MIGDNEEDVFIYEPEDCDACGCSAGEFEESDYENGAWKCPECGSVQ